MKGVATMGSKYKPVTNTNPGPGAYSGDSQVKRSGNANGKIGTTARPDIWEGTKEASKAPGPGNYLETTNTFGKNMKGVATMGSKYKPAKNLNPGPG
jgi:hypothetical protein